MLSVHLKCQPGAEPVAEDLLLRMPQASGVVDPEPFRARARGEGPALAEAFALAGGMRSLHLKAGQDAPLFDLPGPLLNFVISGAVTIDTGNIGRITLSPGDIFLADAGLADSFAGMTGDCRLIQLLVEPDWPGPKARPINPDATHPRGNRECNFKRMVKGSDDKSYFHDFPEIFSSTGCWSPITPLIGFRFIGMAQNTFIDWHPEIVNNLVIVMSGALELEVGGGTGEAQIFRQGDICLAQDRTGEGHIDRVHGFVQVAVLIVDDSDLWPLAR